MASEKAKGALEKKVSGANTVKVSPSKGMEQLMNKMASQIKKLYLVWFQARDFKELP